MYKNYNFEANYLSPTSVRRSKRIGDSIKSVAEKLVPFLIIAACFAFLWR